MEKVMQLGQAIKPISWIKENATQMIRDIENTGKPVVITQNGKAKAVVMDISRYDELQESLALLRMLAVSSEQIQTGQHRPADELFDELEHELDQKDAEAAGAKHKEISSND
jgi:prevent-host-death family protein